jgi:hypothetical protein
MLGHSNPSMAVRMLDNDDALSITDPIGLEAREWIISLGPSFPPDME